MLTPCTKCSYRLGMHENTFYFGIAGAVESAMDASGAGL